MTARVTLTGEVGLEASDRFQDTSGLGRLGRLVFAYLTTERQRPVARDELAEVVWGDDLPRTWETSLRVVVSKLRTWLAEAGLDRLGSLTSASGTYQLHLPGGVTVDVEVAAAELEQARAALAAGDAPAARRLAASAARAGSREFLPGASGAWVERRQGELRDLRVLALEVVADAALAQADPVAALAAAEDAVAAEPLRESAHLRLITAHAAAGNRAAALRAYERLRVALAEELGMSPSPAVEDVYLRLLQEDAPAPAAAVPRTRTPRRLPASPSSFVGRTAARREVEGLVAAGRLVTLSGTGGMGKTRLALEAGRAVAPAFGDGAVLVPLGEVQAGRDVVARTLAALGVPEDPRPDADPVSEVVRVLADEDVLLVVDNCEHVVHDAARLVEAVLAGCAGVAVLATSREALRVPGEVVYPVEGLTAAEAAELWATRAGPVRPADATALEEVCRRLDGIPLAIELAAARAGVLSLPEIAAHLDNRFRLLAVGERTAPTRHQTLRNAIDWSFDALAGNERLLFARLSVFAGSFTTAAAARVAGSAEPLATIDALGALAARSLLAVERPEDGPPRFRMLETIRAYAAEKLTDSPNGPDAAHRLVAWAADLAEEAERHLDGADQAAWLAALEAEHPNLVAALAADPGSTDALRLATALGRFWEVRGHYQEGRQWLRDVIADNPDAPPLLRARAHNAAALLAQRQGDWAAARSRLEESLALRRQEGDDLGVAMALHGLGNLAAVQHDLDRARDLFLEALATGRSLGDPGLVAAAVTNLGWVAHRAADLPTARARYEEALAIRREQGDAGGAALALGHLGDLAYQQGRYAEAAAAHEESLALRRELGDKGGQADDLSTLGHLALRDGDVDAARSHLRESLALRRELGDAAAVPAAYLALSDIELAAGDTEAAGALLDRAAAAAHDLRDPVTLAHVLVHQGRVARLEGRWADAAARYAASRASLSADAVTAEWLEGVGATLAASGEPARGALLLGAADALRTALGAPVPPHEVRAHEHDVAAVKAALGAERFAAAWEQGHRLNVDAAIAEAGH